MRKRRIGGGKGEKWPLAGQELSGFCEIPDGLKTHKGRDQVITVKCGLTLGGKESCPQVEKTERKGKGIAQGKVSNGKARCRGFSLYTERSACLGLVTLSGLKRGAT